jgi:hypothetical protein
MAFVIPDLVVETAINPGTGSISLAGAAPNRRSFVEGVGSGNTCEYWITDGTQTEHGFGIVTAGTPNTLSRDTVLNNTAGTMARLNFTGMVTVYSAPGASLLTGLRTTHRGPGAPSQPQAGMMWLDTGAAPWKLKIHDGQNWITQGAVDASADKYTPYVNGGPFLPGPQGVEVFTSSASWVVPAGVTRAYVTVIGGGGGGGYASAGGAGGGGGGMSEELVAGLVPGTSVMVTVGAGGSGQTGSGAATAGGTSSFGTYCSATGGNPGFGATPGQSGRGTGGDVNRGQGDGHRPTAGSGEYFGGAGGGPGGSGGRNTGDGGGGTGPGGGGGGSGGNGTTAGAGGTGANGLVVIRW